MMRIRKRWAMIGWAALAVLVFFAILVLIEVVQRL